MTKVTISIESEWVSWLLNVTFNDISVIYVTAQRCTGGLKKKLNLWSGSRRQRHFVGFSLQAPIRATLFTVISRNCPIYSSFTTRWGYGGPFLIFNPRGPHGETISFSILQTFLSWISIFLHRPAMAFLFPSFYDMPELAPLTCLIVLL